MRLCAMSKLGKQQEDRGPPGKRQGEDKGSARSRGSRRCTVCSCTVPESCWDQHVQGIKHRRLALGTQCVSVFEDLGAAAASSYTSNDPVLARLKAVAGSGSVTTSNTNRIGGGRGSGPGQPGAQQQGSAAGPSRAGMGPGSSRQASHAAASAGPSSSLGPEVWPSLQQQLLRELVHMTGTGGRLLGRATALFGNQRLGQAQASLEAKLQEHRAALARAAAAATRPGRSKRAGASSSSSSKSIPWLELTSQELACLSRCCCEIRWLKELRIAAPFQSEGAESCAYTAALCALLSGLRTHPALTSISIRLTNKQRLYQHLLRTRGPALAIPPSLTALWSRVLSVLASLGQANLGLRSISLATPPGLLAGHAMESLGRDLADPGPRKAVRTALLLGTHKRVGSRSIIRRLPRDILEQVLGAAVPLQAPKLHWDLLAWMPGPGSSSSSSSSSDDDSSTDSSDEGSSSEDDSSSSGDASDDNDRQMAPDVLAVASFL